MGGACHLACGDLRASEKVGTAPPSKNASPPPQRGSQRSRAGSPRPKEHEGQRRATLQVKTGGFRLGDFMASNPGKIADFYEFENKVIGEGGFGSVVRGRDKRTAQIFAVKRIQKKKMSEDAKLREEIDIMRLLDHPHIVRLVESFEDKRSVYLVMELCKGGELFERLASSGAVTEKAASLCVRQMLLAINYLHQNLIIHRDLKPENWLLETDEEVGKAPLKLIDFGISVRFQLGTPCVTKVGTPAYAAPEVLAGRYNQKVDIWSSGVIIYMMLSGTLPFPGKNPDQILKRVKEAKVSTDGPEWRKVTMQAKSMVRMCLQKDPGARPSAAQALDMDWVKAGHLTHQNEAGGPTTLEVGNLKKFTQMNQIKRAALTVIATQLPASKINDLKSLFLGMDDNSDGTVSAAELKEALKRAGIEIPKDLQMMLKEADTDGSGVMDWTEFIAATMDKQVYHQESVVWAAFKKFDIDDSGTISKAELAKVLGDGTVLETMHMEESGAARVFADIDKNGDGVIDFDEFFTMMRASDEGRKSDGTEEDHSAALVKRPSARKMSAASPRPSGRKTSKTFASPRASGRKNSKTGGSPRASGRKNTIQRKEEESVVQRDFPDPPAEKKEGGTGDIGTKSYSIGIAKFNEICE